jgi:hypothetical protein
MYEGEVPSLSKLEAFGASKEFVIPAAARQKAVKIARICSKISATVPILP